jgi:hypothetical protein
MSRLCRVILTIGVSSLALAVAGAHAQTNRGTIQGRVADSTGAVLRGATVTVTAERMPSPTRKAAI